ncbi:Inorganic pyrophosphatase [Mizuhopecten yessoensis]|uniref:Inorganic pyrophosphatase n=1 Tax=Mizuhopecten yessoensis TaxID=6573 RepID=A0A210R4B9_MIZYE|nr:Inorganic pyrophosphatase [Mizuhopecten yessoensis]
MSYSIVERGSRFTMDYRVFFTDSQQNVISPFHDIPLYPSSSDQSVCNMVVEIPRWSNAKMEISTQEKMNPIKQDVKKEKPRFVKNVFPHHGYIWNYGAFPQTYEDPKITTPDTGCKGDSDPLDVCEIGYKVHPRGSVIQVKILGTLALIDEGETDWKILAIDVTDPLAEKLNDIEDIDKHMPGFLKATVEWFKIYKMPDGKPENTFAFDGEAKNKEYALKVVEECSKQWKDLIGKNVECDSIKCENTTVAGSPYKIENQEANACVENHPALQEAEVLGPEVDKWYYAILPPVEGSLTTPLSTGFKVKSRSSPWFPRSKQDGDEFWQKDFFIMV